MTGENGLWLISLQLHWKLNDCACTLMIIESSIFANLHLRDCKRLLIRLDKKRIDRWSEAVQTIDFSHSSQKAWSILNNLTDRSRRSPCYCAVSANAIAFQLIRNGRHENIDRESSRLILQEVSDLWRAIPTSPVNVELKV